MHWIKIRSKFICFTFLYLCSIFKLFLFFLLLLHFCKNVYINKYVQRTTTFFILWKVQIQNQQTIITSYQYRDIQLQFISMCTSNHKSMSMSMFHTHNSSNHTVLPRNRSSSIVEIQLEVLSQLFPCSCVTVGSNYLFDIVHVCLLSPFSRDEVVILIFFIKCSIL